jgi:hypothetical protein
MLFCALYLVFSAIFGRALQFWDWAGPGQCYDTRLLAMPSASHPYVDVIYLSVTCFFMFISCSVPVYVLLFMTTRDVKEAEQRAETVLILSFVQYPLHLYSVVALRVSNGGQLEGDSEDSWGFGQVVALVLLGAVLARCVYGVCGESEPRPLSDLGADSLTLRAPAWFLRPGRDSGRGTPRPSVRIRRYSV